MPQVHHDSPLASSSTSISDPERNWTKMINTSFVSTLDYVGTTREDTGTQGSRFLVGSCPDTGRKDKQQ